MKKTKITKKDIQQIIAEEASVIKRKKEIYEAMKAFDKELEQLNKKGIGKIGLNERAMVVGAQGFAPIMNTDQAAKQPDQTQAGSAPEVTTTTVDAKETTPTSTTPTPPSFPTDKPKTGAQAHPSGFVNPQNISRFAELEAEFAPDAAVVLDNPESKGMVDMPGDKPMVDQDIAKQLIDMKQTLDMILSSMGTSLKPEIGSEDTEADQAAAQTETPEDVEEEGEEEEKEETKKKNPFPPKKDKKEDKEDEESDEEEEDDEEADEEDDEEEEEIVISETKKKAVSKKTGK